MLEWMYLSNITQNVEYLINNKLMNQSVLDRATSNALHAKFAAGLFDQPLVTNMSAARIAIINNETARTISKEAALQGIVLLKNNNNLLPLDASEHH